MIAGAALLLLSAAAPAPSSLLLLSAAAPAPSSLLRPAGIVRAAPLPATTITVRQGETLGHVAIRARAGAMAIARANGLAPPYRLAPGRTLKVPAGRHHLVRGGETGIAIARAYGVPWARVVAENGLPEPYQLRAGERLVIPAPSRPATLEERAAAFHLDIADLLSGGEPALARNQTPARPVQGTRTVAPQRPLAAAPARFTGRFRWPADGEVVTRFGPQPDGRRSDGVVIKARSGSPIRAAADGTVAYAGRDLPAYRGLILVRHGGGWITAYGYAASITARRGQAVRQGDVLGKAGARDPRILFQLRRDRTAIDPLPVLPKDMKSPDSLTHKAWFSAALPSRYWDRARRTG